MVVSAQDRVTGRRIAIKKCANLFVDPVDARKIGREIRIMSQLDHPNVVKVRRQTTDWPGPRGELCRRRIQGSTRQAFTALNLHVTFLCCVR
jgi:hypothetical protein